ncbi:hypothetical protein, partial [uncultured Succinatimonas sp.]|uniref:hypothetical protein n=1 Tax=uncultured Succinatimonas sp. TaxID=1262973 RepID=UPI0025DEEC91
QKITDKKNHEAQAIIEMLPMINAVHCICHQQCKNDPQGVRTKSWTETGRKTLCFHTKIDLEQ